MQDLGGRGGGALAVRLMFTDFPQIIIFDLLQCKTYIQTIESLKQTVYRS